MKKSAIALALGGIATLTIGCAATAQENLHTAAAAAVDHSDPEAVASFAARHNVQLVNAAGQPAGTVTLKQGRTGLLMVVEAEGLTPGWHGIHIHATGTCEAPFTSAGAHINHADAKVPHGLLNAAGPDDGDLPNIHADANGSVKAELFTTRARIAETGSGQWLLDADGSAIVIHANRDDHASQPIGGAGDRVACGEIHAH